MPRMPEIRFIFSFTPCEIGTTFNASLNTVIIKTTSVYHKDSIVESRVSWRKVTTPTDIIKDLLECMADGEQNRDLVDV